MACGSGDRSSRMSPEGQNVDERMEYDILFNHFKRHKVEISNAIKKTFPFLEGLRDRELITKKLFEDSQDSCRNLVPVHRVVYNVLCELEKNFNLELLDALFSDVNMREYPDLITLRETFKNVRRLHLRQGNGEGNMQSLEQGTVENSFPRSLTWLRADPSSPNGTNLPENRLSENRCEAGQTHGRRDDTTSDQINAPGSHQANEQSHQESEPAEPSDLEVAQGNNGEDNGDGDTGVETARPSPCNGGRAQVSNPTMQIPPCAVHLVDIKKEMPFFHTEVGPPAQARTNHYQATDVIVISSEDSEDSEEPATASSSAWRSTPVINNHAPPDLSGRQEAQEATCSRSHGNLDFRNSPAVRNNFRKRARAHDNDSSESSEEDVSPSTRSATWRHHTSTGKMSSWRIHDKKRWNSSEGSSELSHEEEPQEAPRGGSDPMDVGNNSTLRTGSGEQRKRRNRKVKQLQMNKKKREKKGRRRFLSTMTRKHSWRKGWPKGRKRNNRRPSRRGRKRGPRIPREKNVNFDLPILPVTCGEAKGTLYKEKFKKGVQKKSIRSEDGMWFTPREFEIQGNYAASKNWKLSLRSHGWPLKELIEKRYLPDPPTTRKKKKTPESHDNVVVDTCQKNSNKCEVCRQENDLSSCKTCQRFYHKNCHIPPVEDKRNLWKCTLCRTKDIWKRCQESQPCHLESEVLKRQMLREEQLKCELILLKVYCYSKSAFFAPKPYYVEEKSQDPQEHMWLNKIKDRLTKKKYPRVEGFVRDMRLIFQNHKAVYKNDKFIRLGLTLEAIFEKNFKTIFSVQETNTSSLRSGPIILLT